MKFHAFNWLWDEEILLLLGIAAGRVQYEPEAQLDKPEGTAELPLETPPETEIEL